ncbi:helix-turn-helix domain-containing protein, partial [Streptococcus agalactiae]|uniref:helix-turn-helix domain-containing protein n=1 Tax=Streptococcus agalactiae TaxID=1311 RepID=UPI000B0A847D
YVGVYEIQKDYEDKLRELADFKRKLLKFGLLMQPLDRQKEIVMNLIRLRKQKGLSQKELAKKIGMLPQTISNIENQKGYPTFSNLDKIARYF